MTVVPSKTGLNYYKDTEGNFWAACIYIPESITEETADSLELCYKGGVGIGKFPADLVDFNHPLTETIEGFHNIRWRFQQWDEVIAANKANRVDALSQEISWISTRRDEMLHFWTLVENGQIPMRVTHNETKISNVLFDALGNVLCMIDLDTVMNSTSLNDFGDAIRSYANTGAEDDTDLKKVSIDMMRFQAFTKGYL